MATRTLYIRISLGNTAKASRGHKNKTEGKLKSGKVSGRLRTWKRFVGTFQILRLPTSLIVITYTTKL